MACRTAAARSGAGTLAVATSGAAGFLLLALAVPPAVPAPAPAARPLTLRTLRGDPVSLFLPADRSRCPARGCPLVLLLQGADRGRERYRRFAARLADWGFAVFVPDHRRRFPPLLGPRRLLADPAQIPDLLATLAARGTGLPLDRERLLLVGHSMGGVAALDAIRDHCRPPLCSLGTRRPPELRGAVVFGTDLRGHRGGPVPVIANDGRPVAVWLAGRDGQSPPAAVLETYRRIRDRPRALFALAPAGHHAIEDGEPAELTVIADWSARFLRATVLGDPQARDALRRGAREPGLTVLFEEAERRGLRPAPGA